MVALKVRGMFVMDKEYDRMQSGMTALAAIVSGTVPLWERLSEEDRNKTLKRYCLYIGRTGISYFPVRQLFIPCTSFGS